MGWSDRAAAQERWANPLITPKGVEWIGTLPPVGADPLSDPRGVAIVDPRTGDLVFATRDLRLQGNPLDVELTRVWRGDRWWYSGLSELRVLAGDYVVETALGRKESFSAPANLGSPPWAGGTEVVGSLGSRLEETDDGVIVKDVSGTVSHFDSAGRMLRREVSSAVSLEFNWDGNSLASIESNDGRRVSLDATPLGDGYRVQSSGGLTAALEYRSDRLIASRSSADVRQRYLYDDAGLLRGVLWPDGARLIVQRNEDGRVTSLSGPGFRRVRLSWNGDKLERVTGPTGASLRVGDSLAGLTATDELGRRVSPRWQDGELVGWIDPTGADVRLARTGGNLRGWTDAAGHRWGISLDDRRQPISIVAPDGGRWNYQYDPSGSLVRLTDPTGLSTRYQRDSAGRITRIERGEERTVFERDAAGRVHTVRNHRGVVVQMVRDAAGRIRAIVDALDGRVEVASYRGEQPGRITLSTGQEWRVVTDVLGRMAGLVSKAAGTLSLGRSNAGWLERVTVGDAERRFAYRADGAMTRFTDPLGRVSGWSYDGAGRVKAWHRSDGTALTVDRDARGHPYAVLAESRRVEFGYDAQGRLIAADRVQVERDATGRAEQVRWPGASVRFDRDLSGRIRDIVLDSESGVDERYVIKRARTGRVSSVSMGSASWRVARGIDGRVDSVTGPEGAVRFSRDARGLVSTASMDGIDIQLQRDESRRLLRLSGDLGFLLGLQWSNFGPPVLTRWANGSIVRSTSGLRSLTQRFEGPADEPLARRETVWDRAGRLDSVRGLVGTTRIHRDSTDHISVLEGSDGVWSAIGDRLEGPSAELVLFDQIGRPKQGFPASGMQMWGIAQGRIDYRHDDAGQMTELVGERGTAALAHDALGRLRSVTLTSSPDPLTGTRSHLGHYAVKYDPFGRVRGLQGPGSKISILEADGFRRVRDNLGTDRLHVRALGDSELLIDGDKRSERSLAVLFAGQGGLPSKAVVGSNQFQDLLYEPTGMEAAGLTNVSDRWYAPVGLFRLYTGGPLVGAMGAIDPVSGKWTSGAKSRFAWVHEPVFPLLQLASDGGSASIEPLRLAATKPLSFWAHPLQVLVALGAVRDPEPAAWSEFGKKEHVLEWLPPDLEGGEPWLGPSREGWPLDISDPILRSLVVGTKQGDPPPSFDDLRSIVMAGLEPISDTFDPLASD